MVDQKTYIHGETEFVLTGRQAEKRMRSGKTKTLVEIKPVFIKDESDMSMNRWVELESLFNVL